VKEVIASLKGGKAITSFILEIELTTDTEYAVGTGEGILNLRIGSIDAIVVGIVGLEVGSLDCHNLRELVVETETDAIAVDNERDVVDVLVGDTIAGDLSTGREG
jgi:hypothetical protein